MESKMSERIRTSYEDMVKNYSAVGLKFKEQGDGYMVFHGFLPEGIEVQVGFFLIENHLHLKMKNYLLSNNLNLIISE